MAELRFTRENLLSFEMLEGALPVLERNMLHCCHVLLFCYAQFHIRLQITRFQFPYKETNRQTIWIVMAPSRQRKFHAPSPPSAAHKLLANTIEGNCK